MYRVRKIIEHNQISPILTGEDVTVAVLDTGIYKHPDFDDRIIGFYDFTKRYNSYMYDDSSHGTHVCGIIGGNGRLSDGLYQGIAPRCNLVVGKVLDHNGDGDLEDMIAAIDWVIENKERLRIRILNISIGLNKEGKQNLEKRSIAAVERACMEGLVVVTAAGNKGPKEMTISPIGASDKVITVGCHDGGFYGNKVTPCEEYSGRGPTDYALRKPDLVAPGTEIISCNSKIKRGSKGYQNPYTAKSGTSMATPIVAGACALLLEKEPNLTIEEVKRKIIYSATDLQEAWSKQGWGMLNMKRLLS